MEGLAVVKGEAARTHHILRVVAVHVDDGAVDKLGNVAEVRKLSRYGLLYQYLA